jgi:hypothetical protein
MMIEHRQPPFATPLKGHHDMRSLALCCLLALPALLQPSPAETAAESVRRLTGAPTRLVWCRDMDPAGADSSAQSNGLTLVGFDTEDTVPERVICGTVTNYHKPMFAADGRRIVFSRFLPRRICVVNWDGSGMRDLSAGLAEAVWRDPKTGTDWVYATRDAAGEGEWANWAGTPLFRFPLDAPDRTAIVWDRTPVSCDSLQLSTDGRIASGLFPHPKAGSLDLETGALNTFTRGCWTAMSPDNSYLMWVFDGPHRNLRFFRAAGAQLREVAINTAPGVGKYEVYHPRWSNHPRILAVTGPYKGGSGDNRIAGGGPAVEVYLGRLAPDAAAVEDWVKVTNNDRPDFYPDAWVAPASAVSPILAVQPVVAKPAASNTAVVVAEIEATVAAISKPIVPAAVVPYRRAFLAHVFDVKRVIAGRCNDKRILVAFWGLLDGKTLPCKLQAGSTHTLRLITDKTWPEAKSERVVYDETDENLILTLYYEASEIALLRDAKK